MEEKALKESAVFFFSENKIQPIQSLVVCSKTVVPNFFGLYPLKTMSTNEPLSQKMV